VDTAYQTLAGTGGWTVHFGIAADKLSDPVQRSLVLLSFGGCTGLALAGALVSLAARDIAQRRAEEQHRVARALHASEERLALAVEAADLGTWAWDAGPETFLASKRCQALLGLPHQAQDGVAWRWPDVLAAVHAEDRAKLDGAARRCLHENAPLAVEFRVIAPAGCRWVRATGHAETGGSRSVQGVVADVTAQWRVDTERASLLRQLGQAQEAEQRRIARDLHDQIGQTLTGLALGLKALEETLGDGRDRAALHDQVR